MSQVQPPNPPFAHTTTARSPVVVRLHDYDLAGFAAVAANFGAEKFTYVVTPNVDHLIRFCDEPSFRELYASAGFILNDSRFLASIVKASRGIELQVCPGSDVTETLLAKIVKADDRVLLIGATTEQAKMLERQYGLTALKHFDPPMGFIRDPAAVETCLQFIEANSPFRFCFLAIGCPQQEIVAKKLLERGVARGMALCIGASINFLTGKERRAPRWMQKSGLEWAYRLSQDPGRLAKRYLVRGPRIFKLLKRIQFEPLKPARNIGNE